MDFNYGKGDRILLIDTCCQAFEGDIKNINHELGRIVLANIIQQPGNISVEGYRHFDKNEISKISEIEKCSPKLSQPTAAECDSKPPSQSKLQAKITESLYDKIKNLQKNYRYIKDFGTNFCLAVSLLQKCEKVGVDVKDSSKGRFQRASLIGFSTDSSIYIFDLKILGGKAFDKGLREILECPDIVKIVHDCRLLSDCLKHNFLVTLQNVRDVEAEDIIIVHQERRSIRKHSRTLSYLIKTYLGISITDYNVTSEIWDERPVDEKCLKYLSVFISFLLPLQNEIEKKYFKKLIDASEIYNCSIRDSDLFDYVYTDYKWTLRQEMMQLVRPINEPRSEDYKLPKAAVSKQNQTDDSEFGFGFH